MRQWVDEHGVARCDRTERTGLPGRLTFVSFGMGGIVIGPGGSMSSNLSAELMRLLEQSPMVYLETKINV